ncbi:lysosome-associated membrane glycoprotein 1 [Erinaceus europaeus]|uniref:Lysosome-associated membrane glycoprotein 1 n=1 Tax=Erinaceus europaeus TaxID=9365 RepID=A0ABM3WT54_ERIEU|nr:lysosome-associated membrane glycoprotein 1 [Erinaceus europaeus]
MAASGGARPGLLLLLPLLLLLGPPPAACARFELEEAGETCVLADFAAAFSVTYDTLRGPQMATLRLPPAARVLNSSSCGDAASGPRLVLGWGPGHALTLRFARNVTRYGVRALGLAYNLADAAAFPNASAKETRVAAAATDLSADVDTKYRCESPRRVLLPNVTATLSAATIQAYLSGRRFSTQETRCRQDGPAPTPAPAVQKFNVSGANGTCLLASLALQLHVTYQHKDNATAEGVFNISPNQTTARGTCSPRLVTLQLQSPGVSELELSFALNATSSRFFLRGVQLTMTLPDARDPTFRAANGSLRALEASVGRSYRCNAGQQVRVTAALSLHLSHVWVQAFRVDGGQFGAAEECALDENSMLIPVAVGGALAGLVLIVLVAYLIGRRRSHAGYQTI